MATSVELAQQAYQESPSVDNLIALVQATQAAVAADHPEFAPDVLRQPVLIQKAPASIYGNYTIIDRFLNVGIRTVAINSLILKINNWDAIVPSSSATAKPSVSLTRWGVLMTALGIPGWAPLAFNLRNRTSDSLKTLATLGAPKGQVHEYKWFVRYTDGSTAQIESLQNLRVVGPDIKLEDPSEPTPTGKLFLTEITTEVDLGDFQQSKVDKAHYERITSYLGTHFWSNASTVSVGYTVVAQADNLYSDDALEATIAGVSVLRAVVTAANDLVNHTTNIFRYLSPFAVLASAVIDEGQKPVARQVEVLAIDPAHDGTPSSSYIDPNTGAATVLFKAEWTRFKDFRQSVSVMNSSVSAGNAILGVALSAMKMVQTARDGQTSASALPPALAYVQNALSMSSYIGIFVLSFYKGGAAADTIDPGTRIVAGTDDLAALTDPQDSTVNKVVRDNAIEERKAINLPATWKNRVITGAISWDQWWTNRTIFKVKGVANSVSAEADAKKRAAAIKENLTAENKWKAQKGTAYGELQGVLTAAAMLPDAFNPNTNAQTRAMAGAEIGVQLGSAAGEYVSHAFLVRAVAVATKTNAALLAARALPTAGMAVFGLAASLSPIEIDGLKMLGKARDVYKHEANAYGASPIAKSLQVYYGRTYRQQALALGLTVGFQSLSTVLDTTAVLAVGVLAPEVLPFIAGAAVVFTLAAMAVQLSELAGWTQDADQKVKSHINHYKDGGWSGYFKDDLNASVAGYRADDQVHVQVENLLKPVTGANYGAVYTVDDFGRSPTAWSQAYDTNHLYAAELPSVELNVTGWVEPYGPTGGLIYTDNSSTVQVTPSSNSPFDQTLTLPAGSTGAVMLTSNMPLLQAGQETRAVSSDGRVYLGFVPGKWTFDGSAVTGGVTFDLTSMVSGGETHVSVADYSVVGGSGSDQVYANLGNISVVGGGGQDTVSYALLPAGPQQLGIIAQAQADGSYLVTKNWANRQDVLVELVGPVGTDGSESKIDVRYAGYVNVGSDDSPKAMRQGQDHLDGISTIVGTPQNDYFVLGDRGLTVLTDGGLDTIIGGAGADVVLVGDISSGIAGQIQFSGGSGTDVLSFQQTGHPVRIDMAAGHAWAVDSVSGQNMGSDVLFSSVEVLVGTQGSDTITGSAGSDSIYSGGGQDSIFGAAGDDYISRDGQFASNQPLDYGINGSFTGVTIDGGAGNDQVDYGNLATKDVTITVSDDGHGTKTVVGSRVGPDGSQFTVFQDTLVNVESINGPTMSPEQAASLKAASRSSMELIGTSSDPATGATGADDVGTGSGPVSIQTLGGDDRVSLGSEWATIDAGDGTDTLSTDAIFFSDSVGGAVYVDLAASALKVIRDGAQGASLEGEVTVSNFENVEGSAGDDVIVGSDLANRLVGGGGNDKLYGGAGDDELVGDTGFNWIDGGAGVDWASYYEIGTDLNPLGMYIDLNTTYQVGQLASVSQFAQVGVNNPYPPSANDLVGVAYRRMDPSDNGVFSLTTYNANVAAAATPDGAVSSGAVADWLSNVEDAAGSILGDVMVGNGAANYLVGLDGEDSIQGGGGGDILNGGPGADLLQGGEGDDVFVQDYFRGPLDFSMVSSDHYSDLALAYAFDPQYRQSDQIVGGAGTDTVDYSQAQVYGSKGIYAILTDPAGADTQLGTTEEDEATLGSSTGVVMREFGLESPDPTAHFAEDTLVSIENLSGTQVDDTMMGDSKSNVLYGMDGNDSIAGGAGDDFLGGFDGNDTLMGGWGSDMLGGGQGNDSLDGGEMADYYIWSPGFDIYNDTGPDLISLQVGDGNPQLLDTADTLDLSSWGKQDSWGDSVSALADVGAVVDLSATTFSYGGLSGFASIHTTDSADAISLARGIENVRGTENDDVLTAALIGSALWGNAGNDSLTGSDQNDDLSGDLGADTIAAAGGDDLIHQTIELVGESIDGGSGFDVVQYDGDIADNVATDNGDFDRLKADGQHTRTGLVVDMTTGLVDKFPWLAASANKYDHLVSVEGIIGSYYNDSISGTDGVDEIVGAAGDDTIVAGAGDDILAGALGSDSIDAGAGDDLIGMNMDRESDTVVGGEGFDRVDYSVAVPGDLGADGLLRMGAYMSGVDAPPPDSATYVEGLNGLPGTQGILADLMSGRVVKFQVADGFIGADGSLGAVQPYEDHLVGVEDIDGSSYSDMLRGDNNANGLFGGAGNDSLLGMGGDDYLKGDEGNDTLVGGDGNDTLIGSEGSDALVGGAGDDVFYQVLDPENDVIVGGDGSDLLSYEDAVFVPEVVTQRAGRGVWISLVDGIAFKSGQPDGGAHDQFSGIEDAVGTSYDDMMIGDGQDNALIGGGGNDTLVGNVGNDILAGGAGNDSIDGGDGNDRLDAGIGADTLRGGAGDDKFILDISNTQAVTVYGDDGYDSLDLSSAIYPDTRPGWGYAGLDINLVTGLVTNAGDARVGVDRAVIASFSSIEEIVATQFNDSITGNDTGDVLAGLTGDDTLKGGSGSDVLIGGDGFDLLLGGAGDDTLSGEHGNDVYIGGTGSNLYKFSRGDGSDQITEVTNVAGVDDVMQYAADIASNQLWFVHNGSNLEVSVIGTTDKVVINGWYSGTALAPIEQFVAGDNKHLLASQVDTLVNAMASLAPPALGQTTLSSSYQTILNPTLSSTWS